MSNDDKITSIFGWKQKFKKQLRPVGVVTQEENSSRVLS